MRVFRCFYILLGLVLCVCVAWCERLCGTVFTDAGSSSYLADIVLEGRVTVIRDSDQFDRYNITLKVARRKLFKIYKDSTASIQGHLEKSRGVLVVGEFGNENKESCITEIKRDLSYMFFLRATESPDYFKVSAFPITTSNKKASKKIRKTLNSVVCKNCAKEPKINKRLKSITVKEGERLTIKCAASGNPKPTLTWERNGKIFKKAKGMRIKSSRRGLRIQSRKASKRAEGEYKCIAENVLRRKEKIIQVTVIGKSDKSSTVPRTPTTPKSRVTSPRFDDCGKEHDDLCLNNGTCLYSKELGERFCRCPVNHLGSRCQEEMPYTDSSQEAKANLEHERTLIVIGIVIACLVFVVICILSYYLAKQKRTTFYKRREERKREHVNESYKPLLRDEVDSGRSNPKRNHSMSTQTDESMFRYRETGHTIRDERPIQPVVANHIFANFPSSSPVNLREQPVMHSSNAQPPRERLHAVSLDGDTLDLAPNGRDTPDGTIVSPSPDDKGDPESPANSTTSPSSPSLPTESAIPSPPLEEQPLIEGDLDNHPEVESNHPRVLDNLEVLSSDDEVEAELLRKHPELRVHLHISEEDLNNPDKLPPPPPELIPPPPDPGAKEMRGSDGPETGEVMNSGECNGYDETEGVYEESSSEDSSNTSSSSESLVDPDTLPAILSLENQHTKDTGSNLSWDEHGTPVISQYACNPYALGMDDDFVNGQLYEQANFRLYGGNLESPPPPPVEDKLRDVREDQDGVPL